MLTRPKVQNPSLPNRFPYFSSNVVAHAMKGKLKISVGVISFCLLAALIYKLTNIPDGMILSGLYIGVILIVIIMVSALTLAGLTNLISKRIPFWTTFFTLTALAFAAFHYQIYSPTLKVIVPVNYSGTVSLVKSNVAENVLILDENGVGYLNEWTFNRTYLKPIVEDINGKDLSGFCVGFNQSTFFGLSTTKHGMHEDEIKSLSFEIQSRAKINESNVH